MRIRLIFVSILACALASCKTEDRRPDTIILQPLGSVSASDISTARRGIETTFNAHVQVRAAVRLPESAFYAPRGRYRADRLVPFLSERTGGRRVIGLARVDISTTKGAVKDWGVLGLGSGALRACVVSTFRMGGKQASAGVFRARLTNVCNHELGHTYGLPHCPNPRCIMADAKGKLSTFDDSSGEFCAACSTKLGSRLRSAHKRFGAAH